jgi:hypothetical protein
MAELACLLYAWHARAQQVTVLPRPALARSGRWMLARLPVQSSGDGGAVEWFVNPLDAGRRWEDGRVGTLLGRCERGPRHGRV